MGNSNYITSGFHAIEEYLRSGMAGTLYTTESQNKRVRDILVQAKKTGLSIIRLTPRDFEDKAASYGLDHGLRGVFLVGERSSQRHQKTFDTFIDSLKSSTPSSSLVLVLQEITDPHNLGAILRTADQFAVDGVILPQRRTASITPVVSRISSGADQYVPLYQVSNLVRAVEQLKNLGYWVYGADMKGSSVATVNLSGMVCLILGSEGKGIGRLMEDHCDQLVSIPTGGKIDSLNVSVATGILCYEVRRQQGNPQGKGD